MTDKEKLIALIDQFASGNQQEFANIIGVPRSNIATWIHRNAITAAGREAILDAFPQVNRDWLQGRIGSRGVMIDEPEPQTISFELDELAPVYESLTATCGIAEQFEHPEYATEHIHIPGVRAIAALPASGESMEPMIHDGDLCLVSGEVTLYDVSPHRIYLIVTRQGHLMFKRIFDEGRTAKKILVLSDNPDYIPHAEPILKADILHIYPLVYVLHRVD